MPFYWYRTCNHNTQNILLTDLYESKVTSHGVCKIGVPFQIYGANSPDLIINQTYGPRLHCGSEILKIFKNSYVTISLRLPTLSTSDCTKSVKMYRMRCGTTPSKNIQRVIKGFVDSNFEISYSSKKGAPERIGNIYLSAGQH